jgi:antitoxin component of MazEF toxin-antitoxin module
METIINPYFTKIRKRGGSYYIILPKYILKFYNWHKYIIYVKIKDNKTIIICKFGKLKADDNSLQEEKINERGVEIDKN